MEHDPGTAERRGEDPQPPVNLTKAADELLRAARDAPAGRAARTLRPGTGTALTQTLLALVAGRSLGDHESPAAATLHVLSGVVRLTGGGSDLELRPGDLAAIPPLRHGVDALDDAVMLLTVARGQQSPRAD